MIHVTADETAIPIPDPLYTRKNPLRLFVDTTEVGDLLVRYEYAGFPIRLPIRSENRPAHAATSVTILAHGLLEVHGINEDALHIIIDGGSYLPRDLRDAVEAVVTVALARHKLLVMRDQRNLEMA